MGAPDLSTSAFLRVLRRLQGRGGWTAEDGSARVLELEATAAAASDGAQLIRDAGLAAFPASDTAGTLLEEWERELAVVEDYPVTDDERRARIAAYRTLVDPTTASGLARIMEAFAGAGASIVSITRANRATIAEDVTVEPEAIHVARVVRSNIITEGPHLAAARALLRHLPARMIGRRGLAMLRERMGDDAVMSWGGGDLQSERLAEAPAFAIAPNILSASVTWTGGGGGAVTTGIADPRGGTSAVTITDDAAGALERADSSTGTYVSGTPVRVEIWFKKNAAPTAFPEVRVGFGGIYADDGVDLDLATGAARVRQSSSPYSEVDVVEVIAGWWRVRFTHSGGTGATIGLRVYPAIGATYPTVTGSTAIGSATVFRPHIAYAGDRRYALAPSRVRSFAPFDRVTAADLDAIAREIQWRGGRGGLAASSPGAVYRIVSIDLSVSKDIEVDGSIDWRGRFIRFSGRYRTTDMRPGGASDSSFHLGGFNIDGFGWTRSGGTEIVAEPTGDTRVYVDSATGRLKVKTTVGGAYFVCFVVWATGIVTGGSGDDIDAVSNDTVWSTTARDDLMRAHFVRGTLNQQTWANDPGAGGVHRFGFAANIVKPTVAADVRTLVLDASIDWRDRLMTVDLCGELHTNYGLFPGANDQGLTDLAGGAFGITSPCFYTGAGSAEGVGTSYSTWQLELFPGIVCYADEDTGYLMLQAKGTGGTWTVGTLGLVIHATHQTGQRSTPLRAISVPNSPDVVAACDLHVIQDGAVMQQFRGSRVDLLDADAMPRPTTPTDAYPLGPVCSGTPRVPHEWLVRERIGERRDLEGDHRRQVRQRMEGAVRFPFAHAAVVGSSTIDGVDDWRDRIVSLVVRYDPTTSIIPGGANEAWFNDGLGRRVVFYTGPGEDGSAPSGDGWRVYLNDAETLWVYATSDDGRLVIDNSVGSTVYIGGMVEATPQLGPRSS